VAATPGPRSEVEAGPLVGRLAIMKHMDDVTKRRAWALGNETIGLINHYLGGSGFDPRPKGSGVLDSAGSGIHNIEVFNTLLSYLSENFWLASLNI